MCGICGVLNLDGTEVDLGLLKRMTDAIAHRGPDGEGWYRSQGLGFGHRRLAVIDLSPRGHQPMVTPDYRYALTYNGEIYNFRDIRAELEAKGYVFKSQTDSEVVLHAWAEWGTNSVVKFNGMFAFALWDSLKEELFLVRDRYGIKPLYYAQVGNSLVFGSEQRAIRIHRKVVNRIDKRAVLEYFTFQNILSDRTFIEDIRVLPAGSILAVNVRSQKTRRIQYWDFCFREPKKLTDPREYREELIRLLREAVSRQLMSDVGIGAYLSGGIDSGSVTALSALELSSIQTFTCGFDLSSVFGNELGYDERDDARAMSAQFGTDHHEIVLESGDMEASLDTVLHAIEEPRVGQSYANYHVALLAKKFVKVVLSGTGGDELFGGYPWRYRFGKQTNELENAIDEYFEYWHRLTGQPQLKQLLAPIWEDVGEDWTREVFKDVLSKHRIELSVPEDYINHALYFEAKTFLHGLLLVEDKLSMTNSLEVRVPFLDNDLVEFAMTCPVSLKIRLHQDSPHRAERRNTEETGTDFQHSSDGKRILREVMAGVIPASIAEGKKRGFSSPDASWFKGPNANFVKSRLIDGSDAMHDVFDAQILRKLVNEHLAGGRDRKLLIWSLLATEYLLRNAD